MSCTGMDTGMAGRPTPAPAAAERQSCLEDSTRSAIIPRFDGLLRHILEAEPRNLLYGLCCRFLCNATANGRW